MALITRVSRLFRADLHAVLDRIEEPDILLRQAVRDMEEELARDQQRHKTLELEHSQLASREADMERSLAGITEELDICLDADDDNLARAQIRRRLEVEQFLRFLTGRRETCESERAQLAARMEENKARLDAMRQKAEIFAGTDTGTSSEDPWRTPEFTVRDADVEVALLRAKQQRRPS